MEIQKRRTGACIITFAELWHNEKRRGRQLIQCEAVNFSVSIEEKSFR